MVVKIYVSGISGNKEVKKKQQRVQMILDSKSISYEAIDITEPGREKDKETMQQKSKVREALGKHPLPPQIFNDEEYCGDYDDFDMANEVDALEAFLHLPIPSKLSTDDSVSEKLNGSREDSDGIQQNGGSRTEMNGDVELSPVNDEAVDAGPSLDADEMEQPADGDGDVDTTSPEDPVPESDSQINSDQVPTEPENEEIARTEEEVEESAENEAEDETKANNNTPLTFTGKEVTSEESAVVDDEIRVGGDGVPADVETDLNRNVVLVADPITSIDKILKAPLLSTDAEQFEAKPSKVLIGSAVETPVIPSDEPTAEIGGISSVPLVEDSKVDKSPLVSTDEQHFEEPLIESIVAKHISSSEESTAQIGGTSSEPTGESSTSAIESDKLATQLLNSGADIGYEKHDPEKAIGANVAKEVKGDISERVSTVSELKEEQRSPTAEGKPISQSEKNSVVTDTAEELNSPASAEQESHSSGESKVSVLEESVEVKPSLPVVSAAGEGIKGNLTKEEELVLPAELVEEEPIQTNSKKEEEPVVEAAPITDLIEKNPPKEDNIQSTCKEGETANKEKYSGKSESTVPEPNLESSRALEELVETKELELVIGNKQPVADFSTVEKELPGTGNKTSQEPKELVETKTESLTCLEPQTTEKIQQLASGVADTVAECTSSLKLESQMEKTEEVSGKSIEETKKLELFNEGLDEIRPLVRRDTLKQIKRPSLPLIKSPSRQEKATAEDRKEEEMPSRIGGLAIKEAPAASNESPEEVCLRSEPENVAQAAPATGVQTKDIMFDMYTPFNIDRIKYTPQLVAHHQNPPNPTRREGPGVPLRNWDRRPTEIDVVKEVRTILDERDTDLEISRARARAGLHQLKNPHKNFINQMNKLISDIESVDEIVDYEVVHPQPPPRAPTPPPPPPVNEFLEEVIRALNAPWPPVKKTENVFLKQVKDLVNSDQLASDSNVIYFQKEKGEGELAEKVRVILDDRECSLGIVPKPKAPDHSEFLGDVLLFLNDEPIITDQECPTQPEETLIRVEKKVNPAKSQPPPQAEKASKEKSIEVAQIFVRDNVYPVIAKVTTNDYKILVSSFGSTLELSSEDLEAVTITVVEDNGYKSDVAKIVVSSNKC